jgi:hypothetical protein
LKNNLLIKKKVQFLANYIESIFGLIQTTRNETPLIEFVLLSVCFFVRYTKKEELYVLEVTRNIDKFVDVFTEEKDSGVCIFRLIERLHQFPGHAIWWSPLNRPSEEKKVNEMLSWLWDVYKNGKNPNKKGRITKELRAKGPALRLLMEKFDLGKTESELCELASCDLVTKCLMYVNSHLCSELRTCRLGVSYRG